MSDSLSTPTDDFTSLTPHNALSQHPESAVPAVPAEPFASVVHHTHNDSSQFNSQTSSHAQAPNQAKHRFQKNGFELFVGNISYFCSEVDLFRLFSAVGHVLKVRIKRSGATAGRTLMYGFVDFAEQEQAERAVETFNGTRQMGRDMRVERCSHGQNKRERLANDSSDPHYEVHITFTSYFHPSSLIYPTELYLRSLFEAQGFSLKDIAVKNYLMLPDNKQEGFGYVELFSEEEAHRFVSLFRNTHMQGFNFRCELGRNNPTNSSSNSASNSTSISPSISPSISNHYFPSNSASISSTNSPSLSPLHSPRYPLPVYPSHSHPQSTHNHTHTNPSFANSHQTHVHANTSPLPMFVHTHPHIHGTMHNTPHGLYATHTVMSHTQHNAHSRPPLVPPIPLVMPMSMPVPMPVQVPVMQMPMSMPSVPVPMPPQGLYYGYNSGYHAPQSGSSSGPNTPRFEYMP